MRAGGMMAERRRREQRGAERIATDTHGGVDAGPTITVHVLLAFQQRRGRKVLVAPDGAGQGSLRSSQSPTRSQHELTSAVRAMARAFRWRRLLETGAVGTVHEIATAEQINPSYVSRVLRITHLAPEIVEAVMAGREAGGGVTFDRLMLPFPIEWCRQTLLG